MFHTHHPDHVDLDETIERDLRRQAQIVRDMTKAYGVLFTQDSHTRGTVKYAHEELNLLGPDTLLSHATELTDEEIDICRQTDTRIAHNPSAIASILGRCPVPELLDAGVIVVLGSDAPSPDRSCDMFRHMFQATRYHRFFYRDPSYLPAGKVLEMVTIDAARALGVDDDLGSLEPGKKADIIIVDAMKPHMAPLNMPVHRVVYYANGNDVETVLVDGKIVMEEYAVKTVDETDVARRVQEVTDEMLNRRDLRELAGIPDRFWGHSKY
jgi:cytosine/adenosine deaminase-related metal-dependent hydrolase